MKKSIVVFLIGFMSSPNVIAGIGSIGMISMSFLETQLMPLRFETQIRRFEESDKINPPDKNAILFVGSSSITGWRTLEEDMAPLKVINRGFGGSQMTDVLYYLDRIVIPYQTQKIVIYEGDNDIAHGKTPEQFLENCQRFVETVHTAFPNTTLYFLSIKPSTARYHLWEEMQKANSLLANYTKKYDFLEFIDLSQAMHDDKGQLRQDIFQADGLHLNSIGYQIWTTIIKPRIQ
jgi:lysophospholipase L1-like esterase